MTGTWAPAMVSVFVVSALSMVGGVTLIFSKTIVQKSLLVLISFAAGALLGDAFLHLIPEIAESPRGFDLTASFSLLAGVIAFFILEKVLHWHHSHVPSEEVLHPVAITNLVGDALHNFVDGALIAGAFLVSPKLGLATAIAVALHEIPQELGDFAIMMHAGLRPGRALLLNLLTGLASVAGAAITLLVSQAVPQIVSVLVPVTAGGFVYIASTDLIPELHKEPEAGKSFVQLIGLLAGVGIMAALLVLE
ncbi:MAG TPA: ZIP family metal transporter [Actinomycetota bacterium]|nr:ZIP family metal transporter [Actinomycetota bacterium]